MNQTSLLIKESSWNDALADEMKKPYFIELINEVTKAYALKKVFPPKDQVFRIFNELPIRNVKVVIVGQDPYHDNHQANGLAFSVNQNEKLPPSLKNIFKELSDDLGLKMPIHGDLTSWVKQGVFLINTTLTVEAHQANSHSNFGWDQFTDKAIRLISGLNEHVVFVLWGGMAKKKLNLIDVEKHSVIQSAHPSPLSVYRGFWGSKPFSRINSYLMKNGTEPINWEL